MEVCWTILRWFKYDDKLQVDEKEWDDGSITEQDLQQARSFELR